MTKREFIHALRAKLAGLPPKEAWERLDFYTEAIEDRIEEGCSEEEAVAELGSVDEIAAQILADIPLSALVKEKVKPRRRLRAWEIVLLAVGSPIWASLLIAAFAVLISLYAVLWSVIVAIWAVDVSLGACFLGGIAAGVLFFVVGNSVSGLLMIGVGLVSAGLSIFLFFGCLEATKGTVWLTGKIVLGIKRCFVRKEKEDE